MNVIPDVPKDVKLEIHRENELEKKLLFEDDDEPANNDTDANQYSGNRHQDGSNNNLRNRGGKKASTRL